MGVSQYITCAGNKGLAGIISNPVIANGVAGLATSATAQATIERFVLWTLRDTVSFCCIQHFSSIFGTVTSPQKYHVHPLRNTISTNTIPKL